MLKIGTKLGVGIGVLLALCVIIGIVSYTQTRDVNRKLEDLALVREPVNSAVHGLENHLVEVTFAAFGYSTTGDPMLRQTYGRAVQDTARLSRNGIGFPDLRWQASGGGSLAQEFAELYCAADVQIALRDRQNQKIDSLQGHLAGLDRLLTDKIQASVSVDDPVAYRRLQVVLGMQIHLNAITRDLNTVLLAGEEEPAARIQVAEAEFGTLLRAYPVLVLRPEERQWAAELNRRAGATLGLTQAVLDLDRERRAGLAAFLDRSSGLKSMLRDEVLADTEQGLARAKEELLSAGHTANTTIIVVLVVSVLFGVGAGVATARNITRPLQHLTTVMRAIEAGETGRRVRITTSDELGLVGETFNSMTDQLERAERSRIDALRQFTSAMQRAQEEERARISRELHDDICQRLTGTKYRVEVLFEQVPSTGRRMIRELEEVRRELDHSIAEVRRISSNLRPNVLDDFGLVTALRMLCAEFQRTHGVGVSCEVMHEDDIPADSHVEIAIYRIAQEALANVAKHAEATHVTVRLTRDGTQLHLEVRDNGKGFVRGVPAEPQEEGHGFGLVSMQERTELLGGSFRVQTDVGEGTTIAIVIPIRGEHGHAKNKNPVGR